MKSIPVLTEHDIRIFVGKQNFLQGQQSVHNGTIVSPVQQGMTLKAYCYGSLPEPYHVQVTFDDTRITTTLCSCLSDTSRDGKRGCEHAAALLLGWHIQPEEFTQMDDLDAILERQSKTQLLTLVKQLLQKQPEVEWHLTMPPLSGHKSVPVDTDEYRHRVDMAFQHAGHEWDAVYGISSDLSQITATAAHFAQQRDYVNTATIYEVVAQETLSYYLSYHDEDGALGRVVQECVEGLGACLENVRDDEILRQQILTAIFTVYRFDNERALSLLEATKPRGHEGYQWKYDYARTPEGALKTAEHTEEAYPRASIDLYQQHVEHLITGRGRGNYQVACRYLIKIRSLYEKLDETKQWIDYLTWVRKRQSRLHTLKKEMTAIGL